MREEILKTANFIANTVVQTTDQENRNQKMLIVAHVSAQGKEQACNFFEKEVKSIYENEELDNHKKRYELAYTNLMYNFFQNQFLYSTLAKFKTEESRQYLKELTNKGYFEDLHYREKVLTDIRNKNIGLHEYENFEYYKMNFSTDEISEFLQPMKKTKIGFVKK